MATHPFASLTGPAAKPGAVMRVIAVLLVVPIALCAVTVTQWIKGEAFLGVPPGGFVLEVAVGAVGLSLLGFANYLWTGKKRDERMK